MNAEVFAVIPSVVILAPAALVAALLSAILGRVHSGLRRWSVFFAVVASDAVLYVVHFAIREDWRDSWLASPTTLWTMLNSTTFAGAVWAWKSNRRASLSEPSCAARPALGTLLSVGVIALAGLWVVIRSQREGYPLFHPSLVVWATAWLSLVYLVMQRFLVGRARAAPLLLPAPAALLGALSLNCCLYATTTFCTDRALVWSFPAEDKGNILSRPAVSDDCVYITAAMNGGGGDSRWGIVYCLDRATGQKRWSFTDERRLRPVQCSPCLADGRVYFGAGFADSPDGGLYCLDAATGLKRWQFRTRCPIASDLAVADGRVFFSTATDGIGCLNADTGEPVWRFGGVCPTSSPTAVGGYLFAGVTTDGHHELLCLDPAMGRPVWHTSFDLPVRVITACAGEVVLAGLGNGTLTQRADQPAGAVACLQARTGRQLWRYEVSDGVFGRPAVNQTSVYVASRDGHCYALDLSDGTLRWTYEAGSAVVAAPALAGAHLLVASSHGLMYQFAADTGQFQASYDLAKYTRTKPWLFSSPVVQGGNIWFGVGLDDYVGGIVPRVYCLKEDLGRP
jgi:outer membrane protein assembly factor BamB